MSDAIDTEDLGDEELEFDGEAPGDWEPSDTSWFEYTPVPRLLFHCAPQAARADIAEHGLDPERRISGLLQDEGMREQIGERSWPDAIYLWGTLAAAQHYAKGWSRDVGPRVGIPMDIYEISVNHLQLDPDPMSSDPRYGGTATYKVDVVAPCDIERVGCAVGGEFLANLEYGRCLHSVRVRETVDNHPSQSYWDELNMGSLDGLVGALPRSISDPDLMAVAKICRQLERAPRNREDLLEMLDACDMGLRHRLEQMHWLPQPLPGQISLLD